MLLGDPEVTANLYCKFAYHYWEGCVICSIYLRYILGHSVCFYMAKKDGLAKKSTAVVDRENLIDREGEQIVHMKRSMLP